MLGITRPLSEEEERVNKWVLPLCWTAVLLDGFDLVVLGTVIPVLLQEKLLTTASASAVSTAGLVGMMLGALIIGTITDVIGRRKVMIYAVAGFSVFTLACAFAPDATTFGILRFLAGLGLGGCLPTAIALVNEARPQQGGRATTLIMTGYHVGAVITALLGIVLIPQVGWRALFVVGALPALVLIPLMVKHLPETVARRAPALEAVGSLFKPGLRKATIAFWVASFMGLLLVYGLNTWLPQIMRSAGYELGTALALLLTLNIGAVIGLLVAGAVADRIGIRPAAIGWFAAAVVFLALLSIKLPGFGVYVAVLLAGFFVFSAQVLVYAYAGRVYEENRATGIGWAAGIGRLGAISGPLLGGALLTAGLAHPWGFYAFAFVAALGATAVGAIGLKAKSVVAPAG
ncbi:Predicted arabinose efflux permease, MFS family [Lentzea waywayandensis]|uniref:Predicted arabinose efflux permease, MFS family n=1 Tax=Lentzea waywayandensis TaxID=84724 RepID=A0A1I6E2N4_9PSEU|nr:aromatic acid/H+ symport family MFS transporter [Lentzea waywayandensis]SFR11887.1 Predicted arabinose efflux permease, MFS family [Lentzea waywayandensis]